MSLQIKASKGASGAMVGNPMGDPGLFGFLGRAISTVGGAIIRSSPLSGIAGGIAGVLAGRTSSRTPGIIPQAIPRPPVRVRTGPGFGPQEVVPKPGVRGAIERFLPGGSTGLVVRPTGALATTNGACPSGSHPNKSTYRLLSGELVEKGTRCVKNRRRNPMNPRALDRAIGRIVSAKKVSKKLGSITVRKSCPK